MTRLSASLLQLCSSIALPGGTMSGAVPGRADAQASTPAAAVLAGSGGNGDDYVFTLRRAVRTHARP